MSYESWRVYLFLGKSLAFMPDIQLCCSPTRSYAALARALQLSFPTHDREARL